ncbi:hypothetical protein [Aquimarina sp. SS2-1]|uniref:hypothetical protein n=1 Tax=Aquimarina besae TaxID=3342247 RepID=UPI00366E0689
MQNNIFSQKLFWQWLYKKKTLSDALLDRIKSTFKYHEKDDVSELDGKTDLLAFRSLYLDFQIAPGYSFTSQFHSSIYDPYLFSEHLEQVTLLHKKSKRLHSFFNDIGWFFPFISYTLYTIAYRHLGYEYFKAIKYPKNDIWWKKFMKLNLENNFMEG